MSELKKFSMIDDTSLAKAYDILYVENLTIDEIKKRPNEIKIKRVKEVLSGVVTPNCNAEKWYLFFKFLNERLNNE